MSSDTARRVDWWIPWSFVAAFLVVLGANVTLVVFATKTWTGLETRNAYVKGVNYNDTLAEARLQEALGWESSITVTVGDRGQVVLEVALSSDDGKPLNGVRVSARFIRPTHEGNDAALDLAAFGSGHYKGETVLALDGIWDVQVTAARDGAFFEATERVVVER